MVQQAGLPFKYESSTTSGATAFAGLPLYLELSQVVGLGALVAQHVPARGDGQGWQDADVVMALVLLNLAGGEHVSDLSLLHAVVTNSPLDGAEFIAWYRKRCGKSEEAHAVMKSDLGGGILPSGDFGNNAAWWAIMLLTFNLNTLMKRLALGEAWSSSRIKALRRNLICVAARVVEHARQVVVRLSDAHPSTRLIQDVRQRILALAPGPAG